MFRALLLLPFRLAVALVAIPTRLSARLLRFSLVTTFRTTRAAVRSSIVSFLLGVGLGWFITTPTGRQAVAYVRQALGQGTAVPVDDESLAGRVRTTLAGSSRTWHLPQPDVTVAAQVVTLTGEVPHEQGRADLVATVRVIEGVASVVDQLSVGEAVTTPSA